MAKDCLKKRYALVTEKVERGKYGGEKTRELFKDGGRT